MAIKGHKGLNTHKRILIKTYQLTYLIDLDNIIYCRASGRYANIAVINENDEVTTRHSLKELGEMINEEFFIRCHNCLLVNMHYVKAYDSMNSELILVNGTREKVSRGRVYLIRQYFRKF